MEPHTQVLVNYTYQIHKKEHENNSTKLEIINVFSMHLGTS